MLMRKLLLIIISHSGSSIQQQPSKLFRPVFCLSAADYFMMNQYAVRANLGHLTKIKETLITSEKM